MLYPLSLSRENLYTGPPDYIAEHCRDEAIRSPDMMRSALKMDSVQLRSLRRRLPT